MFCTESAKLALMLRLTVVQLFAVTEVTKMCVWVHVRVCHYAVPLLPVCWGAVAAKAGGEAAPAASCRTPASVAMDKKKSHIQH